MQGTLTKGEERYIKLDLLIKVACLVKKQIMFVISKAANLSFQLSSTRRPTVRAPCINVKVLLYQKALTF